MKNNTIYKSKFTNASRQPGPGWGWQSEQGGCACAVELQDEAGKSEGGATRALQAQHGRTSGPLSGSPQLNGEDIPTSADGGNAFAEWPDETYWGDSDEYEIRWYVLRCTYGRERQAAELLMDEGIETFCPTAQVHRKRGSKTIITESSLLPNLFFAYASKVELKTLMREISNLRMLRFYCRRERLGREWHYCPLWIPDGQLESFRIICAVREADTLFLENEVPKFNRGQLVRVKEGKFKGVVGRVARFKGQLRVAVNIEGIVTSITAYIPSAFLEPLQS